MTVSTSLLDRVVNLLEEGLDVGVRIGHLPDSSLQAIRVGQVRSVLCASPIYLQQHGVPRAPEDLAAHVLIAASGISPRPAWNFMRGGQAFSLKVDPRLTVTTNDGAIEAARGGFGIARLLSYQVAPLLASGELRVVLEEYEMPALPIHVIYREGRQSAAKVRCFVDMVAERLRGEVSLN